MMKNETVYCPYCHKYVQYDLKQVPIVKSMKDIEYGFFIYEAYCPECGTKFITKALEEENKESLEEQYYRRIYESDFNE